MNTRSLHRLTERVRSTAGLGALMIACKSGACFALPRLDAELVGPATPIVGVLLAALAGVAFLAWARLRSGSAAWGFTIAAILSLDWLLTLGALGVPSMHPALQLSVIAFVYVGAAFLCAATWCGAAVLRREGACGSRLGRRRNQRRPAPATRSKTAA